MVALNTHFATLKSRIEPNEDRREIAQDMAAKVREHLQKHETFLTEAPHSRLAGSYARATAIKGIKDVDILTFAHPSMKDKGIKGLLEALRDALKELPEALADCGDVNLRQQRRSVHVHLIDHNLRLDVVPVLLPDDKNAAGTLQIPDREWDQWVNTRPIGYASTLSKINAANEDKVVPLVKMIKHWRDLHFKIMRPKSYWLECLIVEHIRRGLVTTSSKGDAVLVHDLFASFEKQLGPFLAESGATPVVPDPMLQNNVAFNWERAYFETFMLRVSEAVVYAKKAIAAENAADAIECWQSVFGEEWFPTVGEVEAEGRSRGKESAAGGLFVGQEGRVLTSRPANGIATPSPAKRFFGDG